MLEKVVDEIMPLDLTTDHRLLLNRLMDGHNCRSRIGLYNHHTFTSLINYRFFDIVNLLRRYDQSAEIFLFRVCEN